MRETAARITRKFNPGLLQTDREVIDQFVVRHHELRVVLEVLRTNVNAASCQHALVVAPRGRGKTMLLARVAAELRTDEDLSQLLLPVRLMEDSHEILDLADLWLETLYQVATEVAAKDLELAAELRATHTSLSAGWRDRAHEEHALAAVLGAADRLDRQLVLMVENLQALCGSQDEDFGWKLRQVLQTEPKIILLATATSRFKALHDAEHAFFELFRSIELQPLATEECRRLWRAVSGERVAGRRIRPLEILTGGSPRLIVMVAGFARHGSLNRLMEELATLIDEHSEYFRNHVEILPKTERRIYIAVIDLWRPASSAEIAERARMDIRLVSASLGRLVDRGAVIAEGSGRKRLYSATERLYCISYKLRRDRNEVTLVHHLIEFMAAFYSESELTDLSERLIAEASRSEDTLERFARALADVPEFGSIFKEEAKCQAEVPKPLRDELEEYWQAFKAASQEEDVAHCIKAADNLLAVANGSPVLVRETELAASIIEALALSLCFQAAKQIVRGDTEKSLALCSHLLGRFGTSPIPEVQALVAQTLSQQGRQQLQSSEYEAAIRTLEEMIDRFRDSKVSDVQVRVAEALVCKGTALSELEESFEAVSVFDEVERRFKAEAVPEILVQVAQSMIKRANVMRDIGDTEAEQLGYDELVRLFADSELPEIQAQVARAMASKGELTVRLGQGQAALQACEDFDRRAGVLSARARTELEWRTTRVRIQALVGQGRHKEALTWFHSAYSQLDPGHNLKVNWIVTCTRDLVSGGITEDAVLEVLSSDPRRSDALLPLVTALRQRIGEDVRVPREVLEVSADIRDYLDQ